MVLNDVERCEIMKNKIGIVVLFVFHALAIPFALLAGLMLLFSIVSLTETDWTQIKVVIQSIVALVTMLIGVLYIGTYVFSLIRTINNKKISFISWLPILHVVVAIIAIMVWGGINQSFWMPGDNPVIASLPRYESSDCYYGEGFQDYTDYCKYYFSKDDVVEILEKNKYFKQVKVNDIEEVKSYFENFNGGVEYEEFKDNYDFKYECIDTSDYFYIENKDTYEKYENYPDKYSAYNVYFFDVQTKTLYYIHSNI